MDKNSITLFSNRKKPKHAVMTVYKDEKLNYDFLFSATL